MSTKLHSALLLALLVVSSIVMILLGVVVGELRRLTPAVDLQTTTSTVRATSSPMPQRTVTDTRDECWDAVALMEIYCTTDRWFDSCFDMVSRVESLLRYVNKTAIFAELKKLEPQTGTINIWGADQGAEDADSHLNLDIEGVVDYFNNSAYFYSYRMHRLSIECGGWSIGYWKSSPPNITRAIQLAYCEVSSHNIRVCGAFDIIEKM